jgi:hypothetical protein
VALNKPYTLSAAPATTWSAAVVATGTVPDSAKVLTDGVLEQSSGFWTSSKCLSFVNIGQVDIVVDLQRVQPIREIRTRHAANPRTGIRLPTREEYFMSNDGITFTRVGDFWNTVDAGDMPNTEDRKKLFKGITEFTSGPILGRSRYVLIRMHATVPKDNDDMFYYVGLDEVMVLGGQPTTRGARIPPKLIRLSDKPTAMAGGYRLLRQDWTRRLSESPLIVALAPQGFIGDDEYHLSAGGTYVLTFKSYMAFPQRVQSGELEIRLPRELSVLESGAATRSASDAGESQTFIWKFDASTVDKPPDIFVSAPSEPLNGNAAQLSYRYRYALNGKSHDVAEQVIKFVWHETLAAPQPKKTLAGFWVPYSVRLLKYQPETLRRLFGFYHDIGFNAANGGHMSAEVHATLIDSGLNNFTGSGLSPNGLMFAKFHKDVDLLCPKADEFVRNSSLPAPSGYAAGVCPTKFLLPPYDARRVEVAKRILPMTRHLYENWEPYMFMKQGCACEACKAEFAKYAKLSPDGVDRVWPAVTIDPQSTQHNAFFSLQLGKVVRELQRSVRQAGQELKLDYQPDFVPSITTSYFDPLHLNNAVHNPRDYLSELDQLIVWKYPNAVSILGAGPEMLAGINLPLVRDFDNIRKAIEQYGRRESGQPVLKVYFLQTELNSLA